MQIIESTTTLPYSGITATIGFFDGVHAGHRALLADVKRISTDMGLDSGVITFREHPKKILTGEPMPLLTSLDERMELLAATGIDYCILLDFSHDIARLSAQEFIQYIRDYFHVRHLVIGYDHRFGHNRNETPADYMRYGAELGVSISQSTACIPAGQKVSSSVVRHLLTDGKVDEAARLLTYHYALRGCVVAGRQIGRTIGFPTANIVCCDAEKLIPATGAYAVRVTTDAGKSFGGMLNIGTRPTIHSSDCKQSIEAHLFDFDDTIYGQELQIEFVKYLRPERRMNDLNALHAQLQQDKALAKEILRAL